MKLKNKPKKLVLHLHPHLIRQRMNHLRKIKRIKKCLRKTKLKNKSRKRRRKMKLKYKPRKRKRKMKQSL
jgi:hypothetical protein